MAKKPIGPTVTVPDPAAMNPQSAEDYLERGWLYYTRKAYPQAIADFKTGLEKNPANADIYYALGLVLKTTGDLAQAAEMFGKVDGAVSGIADRQRATIITRLAHGQVNQIKTGDWNLEKEVWEKPH